MGVPHILHLPTRPSALSTQACLRRLMRQMAEFNTWAGLLVTWYPGYSWYCGHCSSGRRKAWKGSSCLDKARTHRGGCCYRGQRDKHGEEARPVSRGMCWMVLLLLKRVPSSGVWFWSRDKHSEEARPETYALPFSTPCNRRWWVDRVRSAGIICTGSLHISYKNQGKFSTFLV